MPEERIVNKVFRNNPDGRRVVGKPKRGGWTMLNDLKKMVLEVGRKKTARDRNAWRLILH